MTQTHKQMEPVPLASLARGEQAWIYSITDTGDQAARLAGLGLCEGARVQIVLGKDPLIVHVCRSRVGIARPLAERIWVTRTVFSGDPSA